MNKTVTKDNLEIIHIKPSNLTYQLQLHSKIRTFEVSHGQAHVEHLLYL